MLIELLIDFKEILLKDRIKTFCPITYFVNFVYFVVIQNKKKYYKI